MNISELIRDLQDALEDHGDLEVYAAIQPSYPLLVTVQHVSTPADRMEADLSDPDGGYGDEPGDYDDAEEAWADDPANLPDVLLIATGGHPHGRNPYAPGSAWSGR